MGHPPLSTVHRAAIALVLEENEGFGSCFVVGPARNYQKQLVPQCDVRADASIGTQNKRTRDEINMLARQKQVQLCLGYKIG